MKKEAIIQKDGKYYRRCNVVMIDAKEKSNLFIENHPDSSKKLIYTPGHIESNVEWKDVIYQHLYIISSEEPKYGDWTYWAYENYGSDAPPRRVSRLVGSDIPKELTAFKKIITSTDESLLISKSTFYKTEDYDDTDTYLPRPSNEFLQAYCEANGKIDEVLVEVEGNESDRKWFEKKFNMKLHHKLKIAPDNTITIISI